MLGRVESGQAAQRRFVGDASHELRSPLATIISAVEVGLTHPELSQEQLARELVLPEAQRMQVLIDDLLLLARSDERAMVLRRNDVDLDDLAAQEVGRLERDGVRTVRADLSPARVIGDPQALSRVVRNLADNAVRHARSVVEVAVWVQDGSGYVSVADDGPGIPAADRTRVFERFVRLDTDRSRAGGGSGLGLAIVAEIVAAHRGRVTVVDRTGGGTVITVQLPADPLPQDSEASR
jgi:signal transduction histidine kinase